MKKAFVFDFDDTIAKTSCKINVYNNGKLVRKLTPNEFSSYELKSLEYFNFDEFRDRTFIDTAEATFFLNLAKEVHDESHSVYILTAREDDVQEAIYQWLKNHGIIPKTIFCVGGTKSTVANKKREILLSIMQMYDKCYYYDDCPKNINHAPEGEKIRKYHINQ
jgi:uncharacterized HAD superfamily protein